MARQEAAARGEGGHPVGHLHDEKVLILDFGSQYTQLIARRIRELGVYCEIHRPDLPLAQVRAFTPRGIVLSGGPMSVGATGSPVCDSGVFDLGVPVLGICYGLQLMAKLLGGRVDAAAHREFGPAQVEVLASRGPLSPFSSGEKLDVWMSHGDRVEALPAGVRAHCRARPARPFAAAAHTERGLYGLQFHPEVVHTPRGKDDPSRLPLRRVQAVGHLDHEGLRRGSRRPSSGTKWDRRDKSSAGSRAESTPRWRPSSATVPSATGSPASSWTTGCSAPASANRSRHCFSGHFHVAADARWTHESAFSTRWPA